MKHLNHVSVEWLKGETEENESDITDKRELLIRDAMSSILSKLSYDMETSESDFSKDLLLLMLQEYELFVDSFRLACRKFKGNEESGLGRTSMPEKQAKSRKREEMSHDTKIIH